MLDFFLGFGIWDLDLDWGFGSLDGWFCGGKEVEGGKEIKGGIEIGVKVLGVRRVCENFKVKRW